MLQRSVGSQTTVSLSFNYGSFVQTSGDTSSRVDEMGSNFSFLRIGEEGKYFFRYKVLARCCARRLAVLRTPVGTAARFEWPGSCIEPNPARRPYDFEWSRGKNYAPAAGVWKKALDRD